MKYLHIRNAQEMSHGGLTIAYESSVEPTTNDRIIEYSCFLFPEKKPFSRKIGREASVGRFLKGKRQALRMSLIEIEDSKIRNIVERNVILHAANFLSTRYLNKTNTKVTAHV